MTEEDKEPASVFIQWKGTDVCLDFHCFKCNTFAHLDADFAYFLRCPTCGQHYAMPSVVSLLAVELPVTASIQVPEDPERNLDRMGWHARELRSISYVGEDVPAPIAGVHVGETSVSAAAPEYPHATTYEYFEALTDLYEQWQAERTAITARLEALERRCDANGIYE